MTTKRFLLPVATMVAGFLILLFVLAPLKAQVESDTVEAAAEGEDAPLSTSSTVTISASKDNTLYSRLSSVPPHAAAGKELSNGKGEHLFTGLGSGGQNTYDPPFARRSVLHFDLTSIPAGAEIVSVSLELNMSKSKAGSTPVSLHTLNRDWGEGTSDAAQGEGQGAEATTGDTTWTYNKFSTETWATPGGDFDGVASATTAVDAPGKYNWSSEKMTAEVQNWLDNPLSNNGWLLKGVEDAGTTAKVFDSRENPTETNRPNLIVEYTDPPPTGSTVAISASKDNILYDQKSSISIHGIEGEELSNGKGEHLFTGVGGGGQGDNTPFARRSVVHFDLTSIPAGAEIIGVTLELNMSKTNAGETPVSLHTLNKDWGEGDSKALGGEGRGALAKTGDATWIYNKFSSETWASPGGDFNGVASASTIVGALGKYNWSTTEMTADVQNWQDNPSSNFGWLLMGEEGEAVTAKVFDSHDNATEANRPKLIVEYIDPEPPIDNHLVYLPAVLGTVDNSNPPSQYFVSITSIGLENGDYIVSYETIGYTEQLPGRHVHFYFNTVAEADAGVPGKGPWILYGGPRPFTRYGEADRPAQATSMCARVANADHSIIQGTGNCVPLP